MVFSSIQKLNVFQNNPITDSQEACYEASKISLKAAQKQRFPIQNQV